MLISTGVKLLRSLFFLKAVVCFIIGCLFIGFPDSHESGFISGSVNTCCITPVDLTAAPIGSFLIKQPSGGFLMALMSIALHCACICALMNECIRRRTCTGIETQTYTCCSLRPAGSLLPCSVSKGQCIVNKSMCDYPHRVILDPMVQRSLSSHYNNLYDNCSFICFTLSSLKPTISHTH